MTHKDDTFDGIDESDHSISEERGQYQARSREHRYTIAEAARLKSVSYHTVSRAIRRGRLPVTRLGRMALISAKDLDSWRPMREKAPRKYRTQEPASEPSPLQRDVDDAQSLDLAQRLSSYYEDFHKSASAEDREALALSICDKFAEGFGLTRAAFWEFDLAARRVRLVARTDPTFNPFPNDFEFSDIPFVVNFVGNGQSRLVYDLRAELSGNQLSSLAAELDIDVMLMSPLQVSRRMLGFVCGDRAGQIIELTQEQLVLAQRMASQAALALEYNRVLTAESAQTQTLATMVDQVDAAICACDADGRMTVINRRHRELAGYEGTSDAELLGLHAREYLAMNTAKRFFFDNTPFTVDDHPLIRALNGETTRNVEYTIEAEGKPPVAISASGSPIYVNGKMTGCVSTGHEISREQIGLKMRLERERERGNLIRAATTEFNSLGSPYDVTSYALKTAIEGLDGDIGAVYLQSQPGRLQVISVQNRDFPEEEMGSIDLMAVPNTALTMATGIPTLINSNMSVRMDSQASRESQSVVTLIVPMKVETEAAGVIYVGFDKEPSLQTADYDFARQIADLAALALLRLRQLDDVNTSLTQLRATVDQLPQALLIVSYPAGRVVVANRAAEAMWDRNLRDEPVLAEDLAVIDTEGRKRTRPHHPLLRVLQTGQEYLGEPLTVERRDGTQLEVLANHAPLHSDQGLLLGSVSILQDRENFKPLDRAKDEFLSVVAHEIRNPLTSLRGNLQLLERRLGRPEPEEPGAMKTRIQAVIGQVDRIAELVARMLDISRADLGKLDLSIADTDAVTLINEVVHGVTGADPGRHVRVNLPDSVPVMWDETRVQQVLVNLLTNAIRYAPDGPIEVVLTESDNDTVAISVRDHGNGVPPRIRRRLFKQYYRFDDGQEDREAAHDGSRGLGIGLYISARLAREHGGRLEVDDAPGGGAIFTLTLPRIAQAS